MVVFFSAGLLSKSVVVTLPVALLIWHWWRYNRITLVDLGRLAPLFAVGLAITGADLAFYQSREPLDLGYSLIERALIAAHAFWFYVGKLFWPFDLSIIYPFWDHTNPFEWLYVAAIAATAIGLWTMRRRWGRGPIACFLFFAVTLSPALGFIDYGYMQYSFVADRFQYLAGFGVIALAVAAMVSSVKALGKMTGNSHVVHRSAQFIAVVVVGICALISWQQTRIYRDNLTLNSHIVARNPVARGAHLNLSVALAIQSNFNEALEAAETAVQLEPDSSKALSHLGMLLAEFGRFEEALSVASRAVELNPKGDSAILNRSRVLMAMGRLEDAEESLRKANIAKPGQYDILHNLGESLRRQNRNEEAVSVFDEALNQKPESPLTHAAKGVALYQIGRYSDSVAAFDRALDLAPDLPQAASLREMSGQALMEIGLSEQALEYFEQALSLEPTLTGAKRGKERVLRELGNND